MTSTTSLATATTEQADEEIRQAIAQLLDGEDARFSVHVDQRRVTLFGDPACQQELAELATTFCSIPAITQVQTRFWFDTEVRARAQIQNP